MTHEPSVHDTHDPSQSAVVGLCIAWIVLLFVAIFIVFVGAQAIARGMDNAVAPSPSVSVTAAP